MQNMTINAETRFKNLPSDIKTRLINLNDKSNKHKNKANEIKIKMINTSKFNDISNLVTASELESLKYNWKRLVSYVESLNPKDSLKLNSLMPSNLYELQALVNKLNNDDKNIIGNLRECICLMTGRLDEIRRRRNEKF